MKINSLREKSQRVHACVLQKAQDQVEKKDRARQDQQPVIPAAVGRDGPVHRHAHQDKQKALIAAQPQPNALVLRARRRKGRPDGIQQKANPGAPQPRQGPQQLPQPSAAGEGHLRRGQHQRRQVAKRQAGAKQKGTASGGGIAPQAGQHKPGRTQHRHVEHGDPLQRQPGGMISFFTGSSHAPASRLTSQPSQKSVFSFSENSVSLMSLSSF